MKILVTGGSGFIGKHLCDIFYEHYKIYVLGTKKNVDQIKTDKRKIFPYYYSDYSYDSLSQIISSLQPDAVIHLAGYRLQPDKKQPVNYMDNLSISANLFQACADNNVVNIVLASTIGVYSQKNSFPWVENQLQSPQNPYSLSKYWVEQTAEYFNRKGLNITVLRIAQVIGKGEREGYALQVYIKNAKTGLPITIFGECKGKRHYVYVNDVVSAINAAILKPEEKGIYNVGMKNIYGFDELAKTINSVFGDKSEMLYNKEAKADENIYQMSIDKAKIKLDWEPQWDLKEAMSDMAKEE